ncbi:MAG: hydroxymethylglutaryl-CoA lyase [Bacteroidota bacterium]
MKLIESPREGMQGLERVIPAVQKAEYINAILKAGFDTVEIGSSVSPLAIPQMADSMEVLGRLDLNSKKSKLMMLVVNKRGAGLVAEREEIDCISYPHSFSPGFLKRNMNTTYDESLANVDHLLNLCSKTNKTPVIYLSMAFGNPYGEEWLPENLLEAADKLQKMGVRIIPLSNVSMPVDKETVSQVFSMLTHDLPCVEFGLHLHTRGSDWFDMLDAAYTEGIRRFDCVVDGLGGCPFADKTMLGNLNTRHLLDFCSKKGEDAEINDEALAQAETLAKKYFF